ncbi:hypothetical protein Ctha_0861 [Chloroherpeton thalassium ATCC 35110]|uniref:Outer membrane protein beta-barrel domain-containing protein n=1 Tax=Chloroherpeton thalassium (strain ATCC 35110 / GB-78) TaxID=517418 RepID=B3QWW5_CHLT3|nr:hypothetical protein [Chloroherpeton thalassium]ACF13329.1 hypothetical protein Ctha_0861 [Chloroherpeton thalassium ATCC 35110]
MDNIKSLMLAVLFSLASCVGFAQTESQEEQAANEITFFFGGETGLEDGETNPALSMSYLRDLRYWDANFRVGVEGEMILADENEYILALLTAFRPTEQISLILSPAALFEKAENGENESHFVMRFGTEYAIDAGGFCISPGLTLALLEGNLNLMYGIAIGKEF